MKLENKQGSGSNVEHSTADGKTELSAVPLKGEFEGECNRTACSEKPAKWYNHSTKKYYCGSCAQTINRYNEQAGFELFGHDLCTFGKE